MIEATGLTKRFGEFVAVDDLSFDVDSGEIVGLLGANGAGKTTTMRMLLGLLSATSGSAELSGQPAGRVDKSVLGYVPQGLGLYPDLTVRENLRFVANAFGVEPPALEDPDLEAAADRRIGELSLGVRRRVAFLAARCHRPDVLILDEPTSGVGPLGRARLWDTIHEAAEDGASVLVSTHYMEEAEECDRVVLMAGGKEVVSGAVDDIVASVTSVSLTGGVSESDLEAVRGLGASLIMDGAGWRVVGADLADVRRVLTDDVSAVDVPATFEEVFVSYSR